MSAAHCVCLGFFSGAPESLAGQLDPNLYFNDLTFDEAVGALVNVLLIMERLYVRNEKRADEEDGKHYSHLLGLHTLPWQSDSWNSYVEAFNQTTDRVIAAQSKVKTRADASKLSKDKTRMLQFCPTLDLLEKAFEYLLPGDDVFRMNLSPEELVRQIACKDITEILKTFQPVDICGRIRKPSVLASLAWAKFSTLQFSLHENIMEEIRLFNQGRSKTSYVSLPRPVALFHLATHNAVVLPGNLLGRHQQVVTPGFRWEDFVCDPVHDEAVVLQAKYEIGPWPWLGFSLSIQVNFVCVFFGILPYLCYRICRFWRPWIRSSTCPDFVILYRLGSQLSSPSTVLPMQ